MELSSISIAITSLGSALFSPGAIFTTGVNGAWYDPSDFSTMFQDAAGTTPVTAVGQPVGQILDKSGRGNHAFNPSGNSANFPVLSARVNLFTASEFGNGTSDLSAALQCSAATLSGYLGAILVGYDGVSAAAAYKTLTTTSGVSYTISAVVAMTDGNAPVFGSATPTASNNDFVFVVSGAIPAPNTYTITALGGNTYRVTGTVVSSASNTNCGIVKYNTGSNRTFKFTALDLRVANDALNQPAYQRVNTSSDYDTVGFKPYLSFNGVNQWLQTNSIDFTYGDKMFVSAGVRKLSDASQGIAVELSTAIFANTGAFCLQSPRLPPSTDKYAFGSTASASLQAWAVSQQAAHTAPVTSVVSGTANTAAPSSVLRVNGTQAAISTAGQGTGNYGNYPLYIGARGGASLWFNGRLYGLVVAGKQASASEIASTEAWLNSKTGAY